jgi:hypothetical protein
VSRRNGRGSLHGEAVGEAVMSGLRTFAARDDVDSARLATRSDSAKFAVRESEEWEGLPSRRDRRRYVMSDLLRFLARWQRGSAVTAADCSSDARDAI